MEKMIVIVLLTILAKANSKYQPNWSSLDNRPLPSWYDEGKFGIFIHWGVFSVPSFNSEWFWYQWQQEKMESSVDFMKNNYRPDFTYGDFAAQFTAEFFNPDEWASLFEASGTRYVVLTSKHHEGFTMWPSRVSFNWNAMDVGPKRDLVAELAMAIRNKTRIRFGLYHSLLEWFNPLYLEDKQNQFKTQKFVANKAMPELYEIVNAYKPDIIWSDGDWEAPDVYWNATEFIAWLYNESPVKDTVAINDRWGSNARCKHGGFYNCHDKYNPGVLVKHKWENCLTVDSGSWGYRRNVQLSDYLTADQLIAELVSTVSCGGNLLLNVGPTHDGRIMPIFEERLCQIGSWLKVNGEAIYTSKPYTHQNDTVTPNIWYTSKRETAGNVVYVISLDWPDRGSLELGAVSPPKQAKVSLLGYDGTLSWNMKGSNVVINVPNIPFNKMPCDYAWTFKIEYMDG